MNVNLMIDAIAKAEEKVANAKYDLMTTKDNIMEELVANKAFGALTINMTILRRMSNF